MKAAGGKDKRGNQTQNSVGLGKDTGYCLCVLIEAEGLGWRGASGRQTDVSLWAWSWVGGEMKADEDS